MHCIHLVMFSHTTHNYERWTHRLEPMQTRVNDERIEEALEHVEQCAHACNEHTVVDEEQVCACIRVLYVMGDSLMDTSTV